MKCSFYSLFILVVLLPAVLLSQTITGKLVDQNGNGLAGLQLKLYISPKTYDATSSSNGSFTFSNITDVQNDDELPTGYAVSENYPNPFNPKTRIGITLPNSGSVRIGVYNLVGQKVLEEIERYYGAGTSFIDLELNGLPNGFYLARISLDGKHSVTKKLMLLYGSQHLSSSISAPNIQLNKSTLASNSTLDTKIDSLVVTGLSIVKKVFTNLPSMIGSSLNLGNLIITLPVPNAPTLSSPVDGAIDVALSPTLFWNVSSTATSYTLQVSTSNLFTSFVFNQSGLTNTNQQISGLSNFTKYYWRVNAAKNNVASNWSNTWSFNTIGTTPQAPILISPSNAAQEISLSPTLTWNAVSNAVSYTLQVSMSSSFSSFVYNQSGLTSTNQQVVGLSNSTQYYWRVNANNSFGTSSWLSTWSFTTLITVPLTPTLSSPIDGTSQVPFSPTLYWNISNVANSYTLQVSTNSSFSSFVFNQSGLITTNQQISGLSNFTTYYWRVSATNNYGSSIWSNTWSFITVSAPCPGVPTITYEGKTYNTVQIGNQCWLKENLDVGIIILGSQDQTNNSIIEKYCYNNDSNYCNTYGGLYQWNEAMAYSITPGTKGICPSEWHIPTSAEFQTLQTAVSYNINSLKAIGQGSGNWSGTNTSGFSALLGGYRTYDGSFSYTLGNYSNIWSSTEYFEVFGLSLSLYITNDGGISNYTKESGFSVRCLKD